MLPVAKLDPISGRNHVTTARRRPRTAPRRGMPHRALTRSLDVPRRVRCRAHSLPDLNTSRNGPGNTISVKSGGAPPWTPHTGDPAPPQPSPRVLSHRICIGRLRSVGAEVKQTTKRSAPVDFSEEPLPFLDINPRSFSFEKYLRIGPKLCTDPPELSRNQTRRPGPLVLHVSP